MYSVNINNDNKIINFLNLFNSNVKRAGNICELFNYILVSLIVLLIVISTSLLYLYLHGLVFYVLFRDLFHYKVNPILIGPPFCIWCNID